MQRSWVLAVTVASGLLAQTPPPEPPPNPVQVPEPAPVEVKPEPPAVPQVEVPKPEPAKAAPLSFDQLRPSQRKLAYALHRAALSAHELGYYRSHPRAIEVRDALEALVGAKAALPEKAQAALPAAEAYLAKLRAQHGLYDAEGKKMLFEGAWKDLLTAARAAAKAGTPGLEPKFQRLRGLMFDARVDATTPTWEAAAKGRKAKAPKAPEGFAGQKAITALWVKRAQAWVQITPQEVEVQGEKKVRRVADPAQTKALQDLLAWMDKDDLDLLRDPGFGWLDLRRLGASPDALPGAGLLAKAGDIAASKAPEGAPGALPLLPTFEPVLGESKFSKEEEKRAILADVKQGPAPADLAAQMAAFEKQGRSRELGVN